MLIFEQLTSLKAWYFSSLAHYISVLRSALLYVKNFCTTLLIYICDDTVCECVSSGMEKDVHSSCLCRRSVLFPRELEINILGFIKLQDKSGRLRLNNMTHVFLSFSFAFSAVRVLCRPSERPSREVSICVLSFSSCSLCALVQIRSI